VPVKKTKDPLFGAAVLKLSFRLRGEENTAAYRFVYDGVLRDLNITDEAVESYLKENLEKVRKAVRGKERRSDSDGSESSES
jgi:hypothetical protein